ncbi:unnamed protein product [Arctia plantaginis]|uniref:Chemosensory protein n=1 Tax=Arctia plantaginis TaxID=874455 RepID=A0A8S1ABQ0_ARCPL|nr:unnamed protein product [Arctia plantaginis]
MRAVFLFCVFVYVVVGQDINDMVNMPKYDQRYDYLDVDAIFSNKRLVRNYVDCLISAQRCTPEGKVLKRILPEALRTKCIRCTERQKKTAVKIVKRLKYGYPDEWAKLSSRWDPTGDFTRYFEEFLAKEDFNSIHGSGVSISTTISVPPPLPPPSLPTAPPTDNNVAASTPPRPIVLNRFGEDGELMTGSDSTGIKLRPMTQATTKPTTTRPAITITNPTTTRPKTSRPTVVTWAGSGYNTQTTRFPLRPVSDLPQPYSTAITIIDQIGFKIIRTTELFTDILKNTVRAVVGR